MTISASLHFFKFTTSLRNFPKIHQLNKDLVKSGEVETDEECQKIIANTLKELKMLSRAAYTMTYCLNSFWCLVPLMDYQRGIRKLPFRQWFPFDTQVSPNYEFAYFYQTLSGYLVVSEFVGTDLINLFFLIILSAKYEILQRKIEKLNEVYGDEVEDDKMKIKETQEMIRCAVVYHQQIIS